MSLKPETEVGAVDVVEVEDVEGFLEIARLLLTLGGNPFAIAEDELLFVVLVLLLLTKLEVPWVDG